MGSRVRSLGVLVFPWHPKKWQNCSCALIVSPRCGNPDFSQIYRAGDSKNWGRGRAVLAGAGGTLALVLSPRTGPSVSRPPACRWMTLWLPHLLRSVPAASHPAPPRRNRTSPHQLIPCTAPQPRWGLPGEPCLTPRARVPPQSPWMGGAPRAGRRSSSASRDPWTAQDRTSLSWR